MSNRAGRARKLGDRYASGKLKQAQPQQQEIAPALLGRLRDLTAETVTMVGRLNLTGRLTNKQAATAVRIGEIYQKWFRLKGIKPNPKSPSFEVGFGGGDLAEERMSEVQLAAYEAQIQAAQREWEFVDGILRDVARNVRSAVVDLCVHDHVIPPMLLDVVRDTLDQIALRWGDGWRKQQEKAKAPRLGFLKNSAASIEQLQAEAPKHTDPNWIATLWVLRKRLPDMEADQIAEDHRDWLAVRDRERIRLKRR